MERANPFEPAPRVAAAAPAPHQPVGDHAHAGAGHPKVRTYIAVFAILFVITAAEVAVTYFPAIPQLPALLTMAAAKFALIAAFYMHLKFDHRIFTALLAFGLVIAVGMLFTMLGTFAAHYREPYEPQVAQQGQSPPNAATPAAGAAGRH